MRNFRPKLAIIAVILAFALFIFVNRTDAKEVNSSVNSGVSIDLISNLVTAKEDYALKIEKIEEAETKIASLDESDKMEWFTEYKAIQEEYSDWLETDETIYDVYDSDELQFLFQIVEAEVTGDEHFQSKVNVASVIFNRLDSEEFPDTISEVLKQGSQFSSYSDGRYRTVDVTETTILAVEYAFQINNSVAGSLYFDSCNGNSWANSNREYVFTDSVGHSYYR